jgi:hypothetical protein
MSDDLESAAYLKGVTARARLGMLIKQGRLVAEEEGRWHITLSLEPWQMRLMADFVEPEDGQSAAAATTPEALPGLGHAAREAGQEAPTTELARLLS